MTTAHRYVCVCMCVRSVRATVWCVITVHAGVCVCTCTLGPHGMPRRVTRGKTGEYTAHTPTHLSVQTHRRVCVCVCLYRVYGRMSSTWIHFHVHMRSMYAYAHMCMHAHMRRRGAHVCASMCVCQCVCWHVCSHRRRSGGGKISGQFSAKDLPGHTALKLREGAQLPVYSTREELEEAEAQANVEKVKLTQRTALAIADESDLNASLLNKAKPLLLTDKEVTRTQL